MRLRNYGFIYLAGLLIAAAAPVSATVKITTLTPSLKPPQMLGTAITWTVTATDTNPGPLTFQFNVGPPGGSLAVVKDFNAGTLSAGTWTSNPFVWMPTGIEGTYQIQVVIKDFGSNESTSFTGKFQVNPLVTGTTPVVMATANPLVALFSAPSCPAGSNMRVHFQKTGARASSTTNWVQCHPPATMTFEIAGMYPSSTYNMFTQTRVGTGPPTNGAPMSFTTGPLPTNLTFPTFTMNVRAGSQTDTADGLILHNLVSLGQGGPNYPHVATDLSGKVVWYYFPSIPTHAADITRPLQGGTILEIENDYAWNHATLTGQLVAQIDLLGNVLHETNTGIIQQQLLTLGAADMGPCDVFPSPPPVNSACLSGFHHEVMSFMVGANQYFVLMAAIEKIFPAGTQGDKSSLPVDIIGDGLVILNSAWQVVGFWDAFQHAGGAPQLDINRPAVLGETCGVNQGGCPAVLLLGSGIAPLAHDWLHGNTIYYWPPNGDLIVSFRHQDWVVKIDYKNGTGTENILWRMGPSGDFNFNNVNGDPWPWFSHQHDVGIENSGNGPMTLFDNGNTRITLPPPAGEGGGNSRGMALTVDETNMTVTPVLSQDLGVFSTALGSAQLLSDGNYFFEAGLVLLNLNTTDSYCFQILPTAGTVNGTQVLNMQGPEGYRAWEMTAIYSPPIT